MYMSVHVEVREQFMGVSWPWEMEDSLSCLELRNCLLNHLTGLVCFHTGSQVP